MLHLNTLPGIPWYPDTQNDSNMPIVNVLQALVDELFAVARNTQEVIIPYKVIWNSIISAIDHFYGLEELANPQAILAKLKKENTI